MENINFLNNEINDILYIILSGISGGKDENLVIDLSKRLTSHGSILNIQFCNDPFYKNKELKELENIEYLDYKNIMDISILKAEKLHFKKFDKIIFVGHSFSGLIVTYYLKDVSLFGNAITGLILLDTSISRDIVAYMKIDQKDIKLNDKLVKFLENNDENEIIKSLSESSIKIKNLESDNLKTNHNFDGEEVRDLITKEIIYL